MQKCILFFETFSLGAGEGITQKVKTKTQNKKLMNKKPDF